MQVIQLYQFMNTVTLLNERQIQKLNYMKSDNYIYTVESCLRATLLIRPQHYYCYFILAIFEEPHEYSHTVY